MLWIKCFDFMKRVIPHIFHILCGYFHIHVKNVFVIVYPIRITYNCFGNINNILIILLKYVSCVIIDFVNVKCVRAQNFKKTTLFWIIVCITRTLVKWQL